MSNPKMDEKYERSARGMNLTFDSRLLDALELNIRFGNSIKIRQLLEAFMIPAFALAVLRTDANIGIEPPASCGTKTFR